MMDEELNLIEDTENELAANDEITTFDPSDDLSDDDIAAALGFATTLSEPLLPQDEMTTDEDEELETADESSETAVEAEEGPAEEVEEEPEPEEESDDEQSKEIGEIRKELEALQEEVYGEKTENTESTG